MESPSLISFNDSSYKKYPIESNIKKTTKGKKSKIKFLTTLKILQLHILILIHILFIQKKIFRVL